MTERSPSLSERIDLKYWAFRALALVTPLAPLWLAQRIAVGAGTLAWACAPGLRRRAARNLAHIPTLAADPARLRWATRGVFIHAALNYLDFFRGRVVTYEELARGWDIDGWEQVERAARSGRGAILLGAHLGPYEYSMSKMSELGHPLLTPAERLRPERFFQLVTRLRDHHQARLLPADDRETLRELLNALRNGQLAMFAIDRWVAGTSDAWPLFGEPARLPTGPFALAARSDAPVLLVLPWRVGHRRFGAVVELVTPERMPPADGATSAAPSASAVQPSRQRSSDREAAIAQMRQRVYPALERVISAHPEQWVSALSPIWDFPLETEQTRQKAATMSAEEGEAEAKRERASAPMNAPGAPTQTARASAAASSRASSRTT